jgi:hypothetical protein
MQGILIRTSPPTQGGTFEVNNGIAGNDVEDSFSYNTVATTVEEFEVNDSSTTGNDGEDDFTSNTLVAAVKGSNVQVRTNVALASLARCVLKAHNSLLYHYSLFLLRRVAKATQSCHLYDN